MLRSFVNYVGATKNWVAEAHGLPNLLSDPPGQQYIPSVPFSHVVLLDPINEQSGFQYCKIDEEIVHFYLVIPLTAAEAAWKREVGIEDSLFYAVGSKEIGGDDVLIDYIIDPRRRCAVTDLGARERFANLVNAMEDDEDYEDEEDDEGMEEDGQGQVDEDEVGDDAEEPPVVDDAELGDI